MLTRAFSVAGFSSNPMARFGLFLHLLAAAFDLTVVHRTAMAT
jgi:hypothetical protein